MVKVLTAQCDGLWSVGLQQDVLSNRKETKENRTMWSIGHMGGL